MYLSYVYRLTHKKSNKFYIGYRYANIALKIHPEDDIGIHYFTSSSYINKSNIHEYNIEILFKSKNPEESYDYENSTILENWGDPLLLNKHVSSNNKKRFKSTVEGIARVRKINKNKRWFNNGKEERHCHICPNGFIDGRLFNPFPKQTKTVKGYIWCNDGIHQRLVLPTNIPQGFKPGRLPSSSETNKKISDTLKKVYIHGKRWYTNGTDSILSFECPDGWFNGHSYGSGILKNKRTYNSFKWYTNGSINKMVKTNDDIPLGFWPGRYNKPKWYTDGVNTIQSVVPIEGFIEGRVCELCNKQVTHNTYRRYHGPKCKLNK